MKIQSLNSTLNVNFGRKRKNNAELYEENDPMVQQYYKDVENIKPTYLKEERELAKQIKKGGEEADKARQRLIEGNLRLVIGIARIYAGKGVPLLDLIQQGNLALRNATYERDYDGRGKFVNFVYFPVLNGMRRALLNKPRLISVPEYIEEYIQKVYSTEEKLEQQLGRKPTNSEITKKMKFLSEDQVKYLKWIGQEPLSLSPKRNEPDIDVCQPDSNENDSGAIFDKKLMKDGLYSMLCSIPKHKKEMIIDNFGLFDRPQKTQEEIGLQKGLTKSAIGQHVQSGIKLLEKASFLPKFKYMKEFIED